MDKPIANTSSDESSGQPVISHTSDFPLPSLPITNRIPPQPVPANTTCKLIQKIVYIKTHKTGSTTTASILERFGYLRNLSFAMSRSSHIISNEKTFKVSMAFQFPHRMRKDFDMLVNHVRYNRMEMEIAVPGAKYISIIRDPVTQLESAFGYFEMGIHLNIRGKNPFRTFMANPRKYYEQKKYMWTRSRNGQLYDFGFSHNDDENETKIQAKIDTLSREMDLVMINEYFDESLILLKRLMCWDYDDILYLSNGIRSKSHRFSLDHTVVDQVRKWNAGDVMLYDYFNRTFWEKVRNYGSTFEQDLAHFRALEQSVVEQCIDSEKRNFKDRRVEKLVLKNQTKYCSDLQRGDVDYTKLIRSGMIRRAAEQAKSLCWMLCATITWSISNLPPRA